MYLHPRASSAHEIQTWWTAVIFSSLLPVPVQSPTPSSQILTLDSGGMPTKLLSFLAELIKIFSKGLINYEEL